MSGPSVSRSADRTIAPVESGNEKSGNTSPSRSAVSITLESRIIFSLALIADANSVLLSANLRTKSASSSSFNSIGKVFLRHSGFLFEDSNSQLLICWHGHLPVGIFVSLPKHG